MGGGCSRILNGIVTVGLSEAVNLKSGCDRSRTAVLKAVNEITATAVTKMMSSCTSNVNLAQNVVIRCQPVLSDPNSIYENNAVCKSCIGDVFQGMSQQHALERQQWSKLEQQKQTSQIQVHLPIHDEYQLIYERMSACVSVCKACHVSNITQSNFVSTDLSCSTKLLNKLDLSTNINSLVKQQLTNNQDILSSLADSLTNPSVSSIVDNVSNHIANNFVNTYQNKIQAGFFSNQNVVVQNASVQGITQTAAYTAVLKQLEDDQFSASIINSTLLDDIQTIVNQQTTLDQLGQLLITPTVTLISTINTVIGRVLIGCLVVLGVLMFVVIAYLVYRAIAKLGKIADANSNNPQKQAEIERAWNRDLYG